MERKIYTDFQGAVAWSGGASSYLYAWNFVRVLVVTLPSAANSESSEVGSGFLGGYSHQKGFAVISYSNPSF